MMFHDQTSGKINPKNCTLKFKRQNFMFLLAEHTDKPTTIHICLYLLTCLPAYLPSCLLTYLPPTSLVPTYLPCSGLRMQCLSLSRSDAHVIEIDAAYFLVNVLGRLRVACWELVQGVLSVVFSAVALRRMRPSRPWTVDGCNIGA